MAQTFDIEMNLEQRNTLLLLLNSSPIEGGRPEGRKVDRAATALETGKVANGDENHLTVRLTYENVEMLLSTIDKATKAPEPGKQQPVVIPGGGYRRLSTVIDRLEAAQKAQPCEGVYPVALEENTEVH